MLRLAVIVSVAIVVVVFAITVFAGGGWWRGDSADSSVASGSTGTPALRPADTTPVAAVWAVPKVFLGEWKVIAADPVSFDVSLTIRSGKNAEEVAFSSYTDSVSGARCERAERLVAATETELTLAARLTGGLRCADPATSSTVELRPDGSITYVVDRPGGAITSTLRKS